MMAEVGGEGEVEVDVEVGVKVEVRRGQVDTLLTRRKNRLLSQFHCRRVGILD